MPRSASCFLVMATISPSICAASRGSSLNSDRIFLSSKEEGNSPNCNHLSTYGSRIIDICAALYHLFCSDAAHGLHGRKNHTGSARDVRGVYHVYGNAYPEHDDVLLHRYR